MHEIGKYLIVTKKEYKDYEKKARMIQAQRESHHLNMRLRFPYYIPSAEEVENNMNVPISDIFPYYVYITTKDSEGNYIVEPDNMELNNTRSIMMTLYKSRIFLVENEEEEKEILSKFTSDDSNEDKTS